VRFMSTRLRRLSIWMPQGLQTSGCGPILATDREIKLISHFGDPPEQRDWRLDENRARSLISIVLQADETKRIFLEPHLTQRLGFEGHPKIGFAGCRAARHDDHIHVILE